MSHAAWQHFLATGSTIGLHLAPPILRSWERSAAAGVPAEAALAAQPAAPHSAADDELCALARPSMEDLYQFVEGSGFAVMLHNAALAMIDLIGDAPMVEQIAALGLGSGTSWAEQRIGTMAASLALAEAAPCQTSGAEHYRRAYHALACSAAPLFDVDGQAVGVLGVLGPSGAAHPHTLGMVIAAAQAIHTQERNNLLLAETNEHLAELNAVVEAISEGLIFVDAQGCVGKINTRASQMLGITPRQMGRRLDELITLPPNLRDALERRHELADQELQLAGRKGPLVVLCNLRPAWDRGRRYRGALLTLRPPESVQRLVQQVVGAQASFTFADIIGESAPMQDAIRHTRAAALSPAPVLLEGEQGVGKELFAHALHNASPRSGGPFIVLNCAAVPRSLLLGDLVGYEGQQASEPAQRGPAEGRPGRLELAQGGTLLLEEISALTPEAQTSLLRAIETGHIIRLGGRRVIPLDVRVIAATPSDLDAEVADGRFRADLLLRLGVLSIRIPPLRERGDDILLMASHMLATINRRLGKQTLLAPEALAALRAYPWPGNVRELETLLERLLHLSEKSVLTLDDLPATVASHAPHGAPAPARLHDHHALAEREAIVRAYHESGGHLGRTAERLGISRATLWRKMRRYALDRDLLWQSKH